MSQEPESESVVTCVYCGHAYPPGSPTHGAELLKQHIAECPQHPMANLKRKYDRIRKALEGFVGASTQEELEQLEMVVRQMPGCDQDKANALNAIHALMETI